MGGGSGDTSDFCGFLPLAQLHALVDRELTSDLENFMDMNFNSFASLVLLGSINVHLFLFMGAE